ncbi:4'-phosphopantetheinyl transferase family protein [Bacillus wiedmannii]|uniref:4'-phosphopantetheinyl transferase family protein n=1 Tax=Bacillus wiedmannii TaxID=1890302 RepID=UPI003D654D18
MEIYAVEILDISEEKLKKLCLLINSEKRYKIKKLINKKDKIRTLIGEILIRTIIIQKLKISNKYIKFNRNQYGKPFLKDYPNFNFNISHSGNYVLCAVDNKSIGIDVEEVKDIEYEDIAKSFFTEKEFDYILNEDLNFQLNKFYELWTLKESYIKCCGQGLLMPLKSFTIEVDQCENIRVSSNNEYRKYIFKRFDIGLGYKIAVCSLNKEIPNNIIKINHNSLINKYLGFNIG